LENLKGRGSLEDLDIDDRTMLKWILEKQDGGMWTEFIWLWIEMSGGLL
jgi:hypothetical protein